MGISIPEDSRERILIYKSVGDRNIELSFLPPLVNVYEYAPVYFIISGGGWHFESKDSMLDFSAKSVEILRKNGFAAVSIDYRVSTEEGVGIEEIISDCFDAARYISHYSETLKIDPQKFVVSGHSAGGHLALMLAYAPHDMFRSGSVYEDDFKVITAAPLSAPTILYDHADEKTLNINLEQIFKNDTTGLLPKKASPYTYVSSGSPRTILCAGTSDRLVFCNSSELLYKNLTDNGVECEIILSLGGGHCFEQMHEGFVPLPGREEIQQIIADFILDGIQ